MLPRSRTLPTRIHESVNDESREARSYLQVELTQQPPKVEALSVDGPAPGYSKCFDDDGRLKRTGTFWTATAHIITAVIGSGVLSLAWAIGQLGWVAGPMIMVMFALVIFYTSNLLTDCYRTVDGRRNYNYTEAVRANLGGWKVKLCGVIQYLNLFGVAIGYTITASISMAAIKKSNCIHKTGKKSECTMNTNMYMIIFGVAEVMLSQIPDFDQVWWLSIVAAVMSFTYSTIGLGLGVAQVAENKQIKGDLLGVAIGAVIPSTGKVVTATQKVWRNLQALGDIAFAYSYSIILIEIQDTIRSPPPEHRTMRKATLTSIVVTTVFYMLCGCFGYAAFGDDAPSNLLTEFGFKNPFWLVDVANFAIVVHLVGAYQVFVQPLFAFVEKWTTQRWSDSDFFTKEFQLSSSSYKLNLFRLLWRTAFVVLTTVIAMLMPFFSEVVGILGAFGFWPLTVYFPVEMYMAKRKISRFTGRWLGLQILSFTCLAVSVAAACGSVAGVILDLKSYKPFKSVY